MCRSANEKMTEENKRLLICPATVEDIPAMLELGRQSPTAAHWTDRQYHEALQPTQGNPPRLVLLAERESDSAISALLVAQNIPPEWELENIVVAEYARRQGLARRLINHLLEHARQSNGESIFLEVRESNVAARTLYEKLGFEISGRRKAYYSAPEEDAILYRLPLQ